MRLAHARAKSRRPEILESDDEPSLAIEGSSGGRKSGFTTLLAARLVSSALQGVTLIVLARALGPHLFATFAVTLSVASVLATIFGLGLNTFAYRIAQVTDPYAVAASMTWFRLASTALSVVILTTVVPIFTGSARSVVLACALYSASELICELSQSLSLGLGRLHRAVGILLSRRIFVLCALVFIPAFSAVAVGSAVSMCAALVLQGNLRYRAAPIRPILRASLPYWRETVWTSLQQTDVFIVAWLGPTTWAASYALSARLLNPLNLLTHTLTSVTVPRLSKAPQDVQSAVIRSANRLGKIIAFALVVGAPIAGMCVSYIVGSSYVGVTYLVAGLALGAALNAVTQVRIAWLYVTGKASLVARWVGVSTLSGLLVLGLASAFGGTIVVLVASPLVLNGLLLLRMRREPLA